MLASEQLLATLLVGTLWVSYVVRQRRRRVRDLCPWCGHHRGPPPHALICQECGCPTEDRDMQFQGVVQRWVYRSGRTVLLLWLALLACWIIGSIAGAVDHHTAMPARMDQIAREANDPTINPPSKPRHWGIGLSYADYGWPLQTVTMFRSQEITCAPGERPQAIAARAPNGIVITSETQWQWQFATADPTILRIVDIRWPRILVSVMALQLVAILTVVIVQVVFRVAGAGGRRDTLGSNHRPLCARRLSE